MYESVCFIRLCRLTEARTCEVMFTSRVGLVVSVSASRTVGREFVSRPGHTKDHHKIHPPLAGPCNFRNVDFLYLQSLI